MKLRIVLTAIVLLRTLAVFAQGQELFKINEDWFLGSFYFWPNSDQAVFSDTVELLTAPGGTKKGLVVAYDTVHVLRPGERWHRIAGLHAIWYEVSYVDRLTKAADSGWIWGGDIAAYASWNDGVLFTIGHVRPVQPGTDSARDLTWAIRARTPDGKVQQVLYQVESGSQRVQPENDTGRISQHPFGPGRSWPVASRFSIGFTLESVTNQLYYTSCHLSALWDGRRLIGLPVLCRRRHAHDFTFRDEQVLCWPGEQDGRKNRLRVKRFTTLPAFTTGTYADYTVKGYRSYRWHAACACFH